MRAMSCGLWGPKAGLHRPSVQVSRCTPVSRCWRSWPQPQQPLSSPGKHRRIPCAWHSSDASRYVAFRPSIGFPSTPTVLGGVPVGSSAQMERAHAPCEGSAVSATNGSSWQHAIAP